MPQGRLTAAPSSTFTWDGASRLTKIGSTTLTYNGLNDLVTRTEGGTTTHYYYNKAIGLGPIVAEKNDTTGNFLRYYVWTPEGQLLYMIDAANGNKVYFYHFDRLGSTLALTNSAGAVTDAYAYTPYGKVLQHIGSNPQPFTFVGKWGIRKDGSGDLYQMRVRYYDAKTARFISREPVWPMIGSPLQLNPYQYAVLDPVGMFDLTGMPIPMNDLWKFEPDQWELLSPANSSGETTGRYDPSGFWDNYNPTNPQDNGFGGDTWDSNDYSLYYAIYDDFIGNLEITGKVAGAGGGVVFGMMLHLSAILEFEAVLKLARQMEEDYFIKEGRDRREEREGAIHLIPYFLIIFGSSAESVGNE